MSIFVDWGDADETIWICRFSGNWTANEFMTALNSTKTACADRKYLVDILADMRNSQTTPQNLLALLRIGTQFSYDHPGLIVVITSSDFWKRIHDLIIHTFFGSKPTGIHFISTVDDAYYFLDITQEQRQQAEHAQ